MFQFQTTYVGTKFFSENFSIFFLRQLKKPKKTSSNLCPQYCYDTLELVRLYF